MTQNLLIFTKKLSRICGSVPFCSWQRSAK